MGEIENSSSSNSDGEIHNMAMHEFIWFVILLVLISAIGLVMIFRLCHQCSMSPQEVKRRMEVRDMVEMQELMIERQPAGLGLG